MFAFNDIKFILHKFQEFPIALHLANNMSGHVILAVAIARVIKATELWFLHLSRPIILKTRHQNVKDKVQENLK